MKTILLSFLFLLISCTGQKEKPADAINLLANNSLDQWDYVTQDSLFTMDKIWHVNNNILFCNGAIKGYIYTKKEYSNYKLSFDWRWSNGPGNSGVLLHIVQPDSVWPACIQAQLKADNAGDLIMMGGSSIAEQTDKTNRFVKKFKENVENIPGKWNTYEILCKADSIIIHINGVLQNKATKASLSKGQIGLQSEDHAIEFKNIFLEQL